MSHSYNATMSPDGVMTVFSVPIFVECEKRRSDDEVFQFDETWISKAVAKAKQREEDGYLPPLHIRHHDHVVGANDNVRASGYFKITGVQSIRFKGKTKTAIIADLMITDPQTQEDVIAKRLPYRSVEIFDVNDPGIDSLALLDHEAPFLELPMLMVRGVGSVASATFSKADALVIDKEGYSGNNSVLIFDNNGVSMACGPKKTKMQDETKKEDENMEAAAPAMDIGAICAAIEDGTISVSDMEAIVASIGNRKAATMESAPEEEKKETMGEGYKEAKAPAPMEDKMSRLASENDILRARLEMLEASQSTQKDVAVAMSRLSGRALGSDIETRLTNYRKEFGQAAFKRHVEEIARAVSAPSKADKTEMFSNAVGGGFSKAVMAYTNKGADAVEKAAKFSREWSSLREHGHCRMSEERYIEVNMNRIN